MKSKTSIFFAAIALLFTIAASAKPVTSHDDPLVKELESQYAKFSIAAHEGDMNTFRSLRTDEANAEIPPDATGEQLKDMADMMAPDLSDFTFMQMDSNDKSARIAYIMKDESGMSIVVQMFDRDKSGWKIGGNYSHDYVGQTPSEEDALKDALAKPDTQLTK